MKKIKILIVVVFIIAVLVGIGSFFRSNQLRQKKEQEKKLVETIQRHYSSLVQTNKKSILYQKKEAQYVSVGKVAKGEEFTLEESSIGKESLYFKVQDSDFYLSYLDVSPISELTPKVQRFLNYIPFNENVVTKEKFSLYQNDQVIYQFDFSCSLPIYQKGDTGYYVSYQKELFFISKEDIEKTVEYSNSEVVPTSSVPVTVYHFIYLEGDTSCNEIICHSEKQIREQFQYLKNQQYFSITTHELYLFLKGEIQLPPNTILITIDDGSRAEKFIPLLQEYGLQATLFLVTSWYDKATFSSPYLEVASHTNDLHNIGTCPGGQGSPLRCLDRTKLLTDLARSREILNGTKAFCYPFYEYNDYAKQIVSEAGFEVGFVGGMKKVSKHDDPLVLPRITIHQSTSLSQYIQYLT